MRLYYPPEEKGLVCCCAAGAGRGRQVTDRPNWVPVFHPNSRVLVYWGYVIVAALVYAFFALPFRIAFADESYAFYFGSGAWASRSRTYYISRFAFGGLGILDVLVDGVFLLDLVLDFNVAFIEADGYLEQINVAFIEADGYLEQINVAFIEADGYLEQIGRLRAVRCLAAPPGFSDPNPNLRPSNLNVNLNLACAQSRRRIAARLWRQYRRRTFVKLLCTEFIYWIACGLGTGWIVRGAAQLPSFARLGELFAFFRSAPRPARASASTSASASASARGFVA
eukprot:tig00021517_g21988.t1